MPRIWEPFLTERDKAHLAATGPRPRIGFGKQPALVLVDHYYGVLGSGPKDLLEHIKTLPGAVGPEGWEAVARTSEMLALCRELSVPVVHITGLGGMPGWSARRSGPRGRKPSPELEAMGKQSYDIVEELSPIEGEVVLKKSAPSAFWGTPLTGHLNYLGVDTVIACGESTSGCLRATVVEGTSYRFRMIVPEECAYDRHEAAHALNLFDMAQKYADVLPLTQVMDELRAWKAAQEEKTVEKVLVAAGV